MPPQKKPKPFSIFDTTSAPTAAKKITAPPRPLPTTPTPPRPPAVGTRVVSFDGIDYTVPADATPDEVAATATAKMDADAATAKAKADQPFSEQAGILPAVWGGTAAPLWDLVAHPIDSATAMAKNLPGAARRAFEHSNGELGRFVSNFATQPATDEITRRADAGDTSGAIASGLTSVATSWLPMSQGAIAAKAANTGKRLVGGLTGATPAQAEALLKGNHLRRGVGAGARQVEGDIQAAAQRARAGVPEDLAFPDAPAPPPPAPKPTNADKRAARGTSFFYDDTAVPGAPSPAAPAPPPPTKVPWAGQPVRSALDYAEQQRQAGLANALKSDVFLGDKTVNAPLRQAERTRAKAGTLASPDVQQELARIQELMGPRTTLAHAQNTGPKFGPMPTTWRGAAQMIGGQAVGTRVGQKLYNFQGPTAQAMAAMQRAALLARLAGQDDDQ